MKKHYQIIGKKYMQNLSVWEKPLRTSNSDLFYATLRKCSPIRGIGNSEPDTLCLPGPDVS